jgi:hypothetical protein
MLARKSPSPVVAGLVYSLGFNGVRALVAWSGNHLRSVGSLTGFLDDPGMYVGLAVSAVLWAYYVWIPDGIVRVVEQLSAAGVVTGVRASSPQAGNADQRSPASFVAQMQSLFTRARWSVISLVVSAGVTITLLWPSYLERMAAQDAWSMATPLSLTLSLLWACGGFYCAIMVLIYCLLSTVCLGRLFREYAVRVRPLHPDGAGGLSALGGFSVRLSYMVSCLGLMLVATPMTRHYLAEGTVRFRLTADVATGLAAYAIAAPFAFFAPLSVAHVAMRTAKFRLLRQIAGRFDAEWAEVQTALNREAELAPGGLQILSELEGLYATVKGFPVWPFNVENVARFFTSFVAPLVAAVAADAVYRLLVP